MSSMSSMNATRYRGWQIEVTRQGLTRNPQLIGSLRDYRLSAWSMDDMHTQIDSWWAWREMQATRGER